MIELARDYWSILGIIGLLAFLYYSHRALIHCQCTLQHVIQTQRPFEADHAWSGKLARLAKTGLARRRVRPRLDKTGLAGRRVDHSATVSLLGQQWS